MLVEGGAFEISGIVLRYDNRAVKFMPIFLYGQGVAGCVEVTFFRVQVISQGRLFMRVGSANDWIFTPLIHHHQDNYLMKVFFRSDFSAAAIAITFIPLLVIAFYTQNSPTHQLTILTDTDMQALQNDHTYNVKTGGDPRTLPDYAALRDELSKLTHPARPDVNWQYVEKLCLSLFEQNGVELQTAAWYTLARTHLSGLAGLNEGLAILEALISHQWDVSGRRRYMLVWKFLAA
jgi:hypothetical protein